MTTDIRALDGPWNQIGSNGHAATRRDRVLEPHVVAILPRGEAIRNFVYPGTLKEVAREVEVSVLSVLPGGDSEAHLRDCAERLFPLEEIPERRVVNTLRELLDLAHGRWLWSEAARERWRQRDQEANTTRLRVRRSLKKLACYPFANRAGLRFLSKCERAMSLRFRTTEAYIRLFQELKPTLVFNGSHVHGRIAIQAVQAAQWLKIPTATFVFSWDNLTSQGRIMPLYDQYFVWNEAQKEQLLQMYETVRPEQVFVTGTPQFDLHFRGETHWTREEFCERVGADPKRPIVLYSTGMPNHMPNEQLIVDGLARILRQMTDLGPPQLLVRVYPKDQTGRFESFKQANPDVLFPEIPWEPAWLTPRPEDAPLLTNMLRHTAVGVNVASTMSLELCMFDKPVINVGYNPPGVEVSELDYYRFYRFDHYRKVVDSGAVRVAVSQQELATMLREALIEPHADSTKRQALVSSMFGDTLDGYAGLRVADRLIKSAGLFTHAKSTEREVA